MIAGRPAATIALYHRRQVQSVDHLDDKPREMPLGKSFIERRRKQKPRRTVKLPKIAHQAHPAGESIAPSYPVRHMIRLLCGAVESSFHAASFSYWYHLLTAASAALMDLAMGSSGLVARGEMTAKPVRSDRL